MTFGQLCRSSISDTVDLLEVRASLCWSAGWIAPISRIGPALAFSRDGVRNSFSNSFSGSRDRFSRYRPPLFWFEILRLDGFYPCLVIAGQIGDSRDSRTWLEDTPPASVDRL